MLNFWYDFCVNCTFWGLNMPDWQPYICMQMCAQKYFREEILTLSQRNFTKSYKNPMSLCYVNTHAKINKCIHQKQLSHRNYNMQSLKIMGLQCLNFYFKLKSNMQITHFSHCNYAYASLEAELNSNRGDLLIRGFWECGTDFIFDFITCDVFKLSFIPMPPSSIIKSVETEKKKKFLNDCLEQ